MQKKKTYATYNVQRQLCGSTPALSKVRNKAKAKDDFPACVQLYQSE